MSFVQKIWRPVCAVLFLFILVQKGPFKIEQIQFALSQKKILFLGFILFFLQFILFAQRWKNFVDRVNPNHKISLTTAFKLTLIGQFFSFFIPGGVGGDVIKALELSHDHIASKSTALSTVIADRVLGLFAMILMSTAFLLIESVINPTEQVKHFTLLSFLLLLSLSAGLLFSPLIAQKISSFFSAGKNSWLTQLDKLIKSFDLTFQSFRNLKLQTQTFLLSLILQFISIYFMYTVVQSLQIEPPGFFIFFSFCCFGFLVSAIPITPAGIGVGQAAFYFLFSSLRPELGDASVTAVSLLQIFQLFFALFGGILFSIKPKQKNRNDTETIPT